MKRSINKCYEIVTYSLFEIIVTGLEAKITIKIPQEKLELLEEFASLTKVLLNLDSSKKEWTEPAHIYRVGVTNAADRGLDMWANFGPANENIGRSAFRGEVRFIRETSKLRPFRSNI